jgi:hypothetical protein
MAAAGTNKNKNTNKNRKGQGRYEDDVSELLPVFDVDTFLRVTRPQLHIMTIKKQNPALPSFLADLTLSAALPSFFADLMLSEMTTAKESLTMENILEITADQVDFLCVHRETFASNENLFFNSAKAKLLAFDFRLLSGILLTEKKKKTDKEKEKEKEINFDFFGDSRMLPEDLWLCGPDEDKQQVLRLLRPPRPWPDSFFLTCLPEPLTIGTMPAYCLLLKELKQNNKETESIPALPSSLLAELQCLHESYTEKDAANFICSYVRAAVTREAGIVIEYRDDAPLHRGENEEEEEEEEETETQSSKKKKKKIEEEEERKQKDNEAKQRLHYLVCEIRHSLRDSKDKEIAARWIPLQNMAIVWYAAAFGYWWLYRFFKYGIPAAIQRLGQLKSVVQNIKDARARSGARETRQQYQERHLKLELQKQRDDEKEDRIPKLSESFRTRMIQARQRSKMTQKELAQKCALKPSVIQEYESGKAIPKDREQNKIQRVLSAWWTK